MDTGIPDGGGLDPLQSEITGFSTERQPKASQTNPDDLRHPGFISSTI